MSIGPIQGFVIGFPDNDLFEGRIAEELGRLSDVGQIRIIDAVFVIRDDDGAAVLSVSDLDDDKRAELRSAVEMPESLMPSYDKRLTPAETDDLVAYLYTLGKEKATQ